MKFQKYSISILIPTFNRPEKLDKLLSSIKLNKLEKLCNYEIKIFDNNSDKSYKEVLEKNKELNIIYKKHSRNLGPCTNFQLLQEDVSMDWFCIISDDDYIEKNHFNSLLYLLNKFPKAYFACNHTKKLVNNNFCNSPSMKSNFWRNSELHYPSTDVMWNMYFNHFVSTGCLFNTSVLKSFYYDENIDDRLFLTELSSIYPFCTSNKATAILNIYKDTVSGRGGPRSDLDYMGLLNSLSRKIRQAKELHKDNKNKFRILTYIYIYEYFINSLRLIYVLDLKMDSPIFNFSFKYFFIKFSLLFYFFLKLFMKIYFSLKKLKSKTI